MSVFIVMKMRMVLLLAAIVVASASAGQPSFDRKAWREDYSTLKRELERSYSHLAWAASPASGVDLPSLDRRTRLALDAARSDADAAAALVSFVAGFRDGHFAPTVTPEPNGAGPEPPPRVADNDASAACAASGYSPATRVAFSLPFESLNGFRMESDGISRAFRSGTIVVGERRLGLVRIPRFRPAEYPSLCLATWPVQDAIDAAWLRELADRLAAFRAEHVDTVLVDVGGNGGGNDLGDWAARLFTSGEVHSAPLLMHEGPLGAKYMDEQLQGLNDALAAHAGDAQVEAALRPAIETFEHRKRESSQQACDLSWVWHEQRRFDPAKCSGLIDAGFASGAVDYFAPDGLATDAAAALYWASVADPVRGAWNGPVYVLTDAGTASAAEMFAARMRDSGIAKTIGVRTLGLGCGSMVDAAPLTLAHSRLSFRIPNCVRLRADGSDEVAGIAPDFPVLPVANESPRARAARVLAVVDQDFRRSFGNLSCDTSIERPMTLRYGLLALLLAGNTALASIESAAVTGGAIQGQVVDGVGVFKGIPFAAPPVGDLRWQVPKPVISWQGVRSAREFAPACIQSWIPPDQRQPSEDCLYLNVWTAAASSMERRPVIVWIHGGGLAGGMSWEKVSDGTNLAREGAVVVTIAYRLGALGFVAHPELTRENGKTSGNYGLHDMVAALRWVQDNIAQFGGDAARVLVIGGSAGASSISVLAASPQAKGLYSRAAALGGAIFTPVNHVGPRYQYYYPTLADYERKGEQLFAQLGVSDLKAARALAASTILKATDSWPPKYGISRDGDLVLGYNQELFQQGRFNDTPILIGYTSDEVGAPPGTTLASAQANVRTLPCRHTLDPLLAAYPRFVSDEQTRTVLSQAMRDQNIGWATWTWARLQAANGHGSVYAYFFDIHGRDRPHGAPHAAEYPYLFGNFEYAHTQSDLTASAMIRQYILNFAARGDPNTPGLPQWDRFEETTQRVMVFDRVFHSGEWPNLAALQALTPYLKCYAGTPVPSDPG